MRAADRRHWEGPGGVQVEEVDGGIPLDLRIVQVSGPPGGRTGLHAHPGAEHHLVLSGRMRAIQGDHVVELGPGDYLLWDATIPHDAQGIGEEPTVALIISHPSHTTETSRPDS